MSRSLAAVRAYPLVFATLLVATIGLLLLATPASGVARWIVGGYALAAWEAVGMIRQLLRKHTGLDILAVTAITAAVLVGEPWAALVVVLMLTGGAALEDYAEHRSKRELTALLRKAPQQATRILDTETSAHTADTATKEVPVDAVAVGDLLLVRPGALVPVDAILVSEHAVFDESSLTGESLPVERQAGEKVSSGAVNGQAAVTMRAAAPAAESEYQQIVRLVEQAASSKAKVVRLADRYAAAAPSNSSPAPARPHSTRPAPSPPGSPPSNASWLRRGSTQTKCYALRPQPRSTPRTCSPAPSSERRSSVRFHSSKHPRPRSSPPTVSPQLSARLRHPTQCSRRSASPPGYANTRQCFPWLTLRQASLRSTLRRMTASRVRSSCAIRSATKLRHIPLFS